MRNTYFRGVRCIARKYISLAHMIRIFITIILCGFVFDALVILIMNENNNIQQQQEKQLKDRTTSNTIAYIEKGLSDNGYNMNKIRMIQWLSIKKQNMVRMI
eukprot:244909_1